MDTPDVRYVQRPDGVSIAYQVVGDGPLDLVYTPGFVSHLDLQWTQPGWAAFMRRLAGFTRMVMYDKPGTGLSDPVSHVPTVEERANDLQIVMDAAGCEQAAVMGFSEGASTALMVAATAPERVKALVLYGAVVKGIPTEGELAEMGIDAGVVDRTWKAVDQAAARWGDGTTLALLSPSYDSPVLRRFLALFERAAASPAMARAALEAARRIDVLPFLDHVRAPTLVLHRVDDIAPLANARLLAARISGARKVEAPGRDHAFWLGDFEPLVREIEKFLTGSHQAAAPDRALATVLFTDMVDSTRRAAELGDQRWRQVLERHDSELRSTVTAFGGRVVKAMGDGHLSVFDGPARAIRCALTLRDAGDQAGTPVRAGLHTGECDVIGDDLGGLAVHIGARVAALARPGEVLVSSTVRDLVVGSSMVFADRGEHELRGVPGRWGLHAAAAPDEPESLSAVREIGPRDRLVLRVAARAPRVARLTTQLALRRARV